MEVSRGGGRKKVERKGIARGGRKKVEGRPWEEEERGGGGAKERRTGRREGGGESGCVRKWRRWREAKERGSTMLGKEKITMYTIIVIVYTITFEKLNGGSANSKKKLESTVQMFEISRDNVNLLKQYQFVHLIVILVFQL